MGKKTLTEKLATDKTLSKLIDKIGEVGFYPEVIDNLTSTATDKPLSANQGKVLKDSLSSLSSLVGGLIKTTSTTITVPLTGQGYATFTLPVNGLKILSIIPNTGSISDNSGLQLTPCNIRNTQGDTAYVWYYRPTAGVSGSNVITLYITYLDI